VRAAVDDTRGHGERLERYAGDAAVMAVMAKLRRFQVPHALPWHAAPSERNACRDCVECMER